MAQKCSGCGAEIPEGSKLGACPKCLLSVGLDAGAQVTAVAGPEPKTGDHIGSYKLLEQTGEGGCGVVYMAEQQEPIRGRGHSNSSNPAWILARSLLVSRPSDRR